MQIREFSKDGTQLRLLDVSNGDGRITYCVVGDTLVILNKDGVADGMNLESQRIQTYGKLAVEAPATVMYPLSRTEVILVDRAEGQVIVLNLKTKEVDYSPVNAPEISESKTFFSAQLQSQTAKGSAVGLPLLFTPSQPDDEMCVYSILNPVFRQQGTARVIRIARTGGILESFRIALPGLSDQPGLPVHLRIGEGKTLLAVFANGQALTYPLRSA